MFVIPASCELRQGDKKYETLRMFAKETQELLARKVKPLPQLVCARSLTHDIDELVAGLWPRATLAVVDDARTGTALNAARALTGRFSVTHVRLEGEPVADDVTVNDIRKQSARCDALVAVGGGTIGDLCKYAAFLDNKPYVVFPTAASMNGYLSANASITVEGYKETCAARMPEAVFCDLSVIAAAPLHLSKSGLGDSLARPTAQADWLLSHLLLSTPYDDTPFELLKTYEPQLFDSARGIAMGDRESIALLVQVLLLSGLGMTIAGGSYPASQGEHMIAHGYEMIAMHSHANPMHRGQKVLHGEAIGVTALAMARRQEALLGIEPELLPDNFNPEQLSNLYGTRVAEAAKDAFAQKSQLIASSLNAGALRDWETTAGRLEKIMLPPSHIESILKQAEAPTTHHQLGWDDRNYMAASSTARFLRERFTFLDLH